MSQNTIPGDAAPRLAAVWSLELELELCPATRREATAEQLRSLARLLNEAEGVSVASAEAHSRANMVRVSLTVTADDAYDAHDRACALVHDRASRAGLSPAILVATRAAAKPATGRRMG